MPKKAPQKRARGSKKAAPAAAAKRTASKSAGKPKRLTVAVRKPTSKEPSRRRPAKSARPLVAHVSATEPRDGQLGTQPADSGLTAADLEQYREMLLEKRAEILGDVSSLHSEALHKERREASGDLSSMPIHMADLGTDNYELEFTLGLIEGERAILREIDEALERIRKGTYGLCLATGKPIGKARLKAKPWAKYCYEYTLAQEQGQGRRF